MSQLSQKFKKDNKDFMVLSAVCILFVVDAHAGGPINLLNKIFPYDSFFMPAFIFISGYFYKVPITSNETKRFCLKKLKRLLVPYYLYNILISLLWLIPIFFVTQQLWGTNFFLSFNGILPFFYKLLIEFPFSSGVSSDLVSPSWFLVALLGTILSYTLLTKVHVSEGLRSSFILFLCLLIVGMGSIYSALKGFNQNPWFLLMLKIAFFLPFFHLGCILRKLDARNLLKEKDYGMMAILSIGTNIVLLLFFSPSALSFPSLAFMARFPFPLSELSGQEFLKIILPYLTSFTGIFFYLYISKLIAKNWGSQPILNLISNNTLQILCLHLFCFNVINLVFYLLKTNFGLFTGFNETLFFSSAWYIYGPHVGFQFFYLLVGVIGPLTLVVLREKFISTLSKQKTG